MQQDTLIAAIGAFFRAREDGIAAAYVFGSVARGVAREDSDIDVAVLCTQTPPATLEGAGLRLASDLERRLGRAVDLVVLNRAPLDLVHRVLRDGILVHETDRAARVRFEVARRREYLDLKPFLDRYRGSDRSARG